MFREALCITNIADFYRMQKGYIPQFQVGKEAKTGRHLELELSEGINVN
jgi:hypothetical protein